MNSQLENTNSKGDFTRLKDFWYTKINPTQIWYDVFNPKCLSIVFAKSNLRQKYINNIDFLQLILLVTKRLMLIKIKSISLILPLKSISFILPITHNSYSPCLDFNYHSFYSLKNEIEIMNTKILLNKVSKALR